MIVAYFAFGVWVAAGLASLFTGFPSGFFTSGVVPGLSGVPDGVALTVGAGVAVADGTGDAGGLTGVGFFGSQAPNTATLAAKTVDKINDLLIVFSSLLIETRGRKPSAPQTSTAGLIPVVFLQTQD